VAEYFLEENPMLVRPQAVSDFADEIAKLRDDVERIAKRIEKLEGAR
jgi:ubiquinone biosynthesis protein UbiJ